MNILGVGTFEFIIIFIIMLTVAGPKRMLQWSLILGQYIRKFQRMWSEAVEMIQKELDDADTGIQLPTEVPNRHNLMQWVKNTTTPITQPFESAIHEATNPTKTVAKDLQLIRSEIQQNVQESIAPKPNTPSKETIFESDFGTWLLEEGDE